MQCRFPAARWCRRPQKKSHTGSNFINPSKYFFIHSSTGNKNPGDIQNLFNNSRHMMANAIQWLSDIYARMQKQNKTKSKIHIKTLAELQQINWNSKDCMKARLNLSQRTSWRNEEIAPGGKMRNWKSRTVKTFVPFFFMCCIYCLKDYNTKIALCSAKISETTQLVIATKKKKDFHHSQQTQYKLQIS